MELREVAAEIRAETIIKVQVDAAVQDAAVYTADNHPEEAAIHVQGRADFRSGFEWRDDQGIRPGVCLNFTDIECSSYPEAEPPYLVVFCN